MARKPVPKRVREALAYRWRADRLVPIQHPDVYPLSSLIGVDRSVARLRANVAAFTAGRPALDALLYGERGTGKSSAVRGLLGEFGVSGFRLVEVRRDDLMDLSALWSVLRRRAERFGVFCDDLSFEEGDTSWKRLKAELDGGLEARPATRCAGHPEPTPPAHRADRRTARRCSTPKGCCIPARRPKALSDRFGLLLSSSPSIRKRTCDRAPRARVIAPPAAGRRACSAALERGTRNGRTARQACIALLQAKDGDLT
jgi:predicted AAA+ superfamily ATPase